MNFEIFLFLLKVKNVYEQNTIPFLNLNSSFNGNSTKNSLKKIKGTILELFQKMKNKNFLIKKINKNKKLKNYTLKKK